MTIRFERTSDPATWDDLVALSPRATSFHDWSWLRFTSEVFGWRFDPLTVVDDGTPVGVFPVLLKRSRLPRAAEPPFPYVGPLVPEELLEPTLRAFRGWQLRHGRPFVRFDLGPAADPVAGSDAGLRSAVAAAGGTWEADRTLVVDLKGKTPETLMASMKKGARYSVRAGVRNEVEVRPSLPGEATTLLPRILNEAYASRDVESPYPDEIGSRFEQWAAGRDDVYVRTALVAGEQAGLVVALGSHPVVTGWAGGSFREFRDANPSTILFHDMLLWSLERGHTAVDLVGWVDEGVARFKMSLGAQEQGYTTALSSHLPEFVRAAAAR